MFRSRANGAILAVKYVITLGTVIREMVEELLQGPQSLPKAMVGPECIVMAAVKSEAATITEYVGALATTMKLDSGSSVSLFKKICFRRYQNL